MPILPRLHPIAVGLRYRVWIILFVALVACSGNPPLSSVTPVATLRKPTQLADRLPTPIPILSGELGSEINQYILKNFPLFSGAILVSRDGEVLLSSGYRYANWELNVPNSFNGISSGFSDQPFTALAMMILQERGLLDLNDSICDFIPNCEADWQPITVHHLLTHTSGIPDYAAFPNALHEAAVSRTVSELIDTFRDVPLEFKPGSEFSFSNSGYVLLGAIIESISGLSYEAFIQTNIFTPLSLQASGYDNPLQILKGRANGYTIDGRTLENSPYISPTNLYSTGGLYSTVEDLDRWEQALISGQLVSQESLEKMRTPYVYAPKYGAEYGYGWVVSESHGRRIIWNDGSLPGFFNYFAHYPDERVNIIVLSNLDTSDVLSIAQGIEDIIFP
jgi:CubicO group peptidase (beta-lactamase class C family)